MKVNLTDGKSLYSFYISADVDKADHRAVTNSDRPEATALRIIKKRLGSDVFSGLYPAKVQSIEAGILH